MYKINEPIKKTIPNIFEIGEPVNKKVFCYSCRKKANISFFIISSKKKKPRYFCPSCFEN